MSSNLVDFAERALSQGIKREEIARALFAAGWPKEEIAAALDVFAEVDFPLPVPKPQPHVSARETFLHLLLFTSLYICIWALLTIVFTFIDQSLPDPLADAPNIFDSLRLEVATLIVFFPLFLAMFRLADRSRADPARRDSKVRRWFVYLTLFATAVTLAGDVVSLIYAYLSGELATRFLYKVLALAVVAGGLFFYFLNDVRQDESE
ncbi:DUF5671 domain-containing protein [Methylocapsa acidiphila]|uniref:DUF5671 domain-containing protein n=1 Tax=Methylocapsa acidiphila TaxID=133552 RepID=UPI00047BA129|nr:DUF5671 domain-containing protein [Methylocapsa acidiphila]